MHVVTHQCWERDASLRHRNLTFGNLPSLDPALLVSASAWFGFAFFCYNKIHCNVQQSPEFREGSCKVLNLKEAQGFTQFAASRSEVRVALGTLILWWVCGQMGPPEDCALG